MVRELQATFHGIVQGVFFRATVKKHADRLGLVGIVKNLDDGSVHAVVHGSEEEIKLFLENLQREPGSAHIETIKKQIDNPKNSYKSFDIIY